MKKFFVLLALAAALPAAAGSAGSALSSPSARGAADMDLRLSLKVRNTRYGRILFDGRDRVLYGFTRDRRGGRSTCYGACARAWPV